MGSVSFERLFIVGAGQMGSGIAQVAIQAGLEAVVMDVSHDQLRTCRERIQASLDRRVARGQLTPEKRDDALRRLTLTTDMEEAQRVDAAIEAAPEDVALKRRILADLDRVCPPNAIIASNTSSIPITRLASATSRPQRVVGMHFVNPVPVMDRVDVIRGYLTSDETYNVALELARVLGKQVTTPKDFPGFFNSNVGLAFINEAINLLYEGQGSREDIDRCVRVGLGRPMGPLETADFIGLDTCLAVLRISYEGYGTSKYFPSPLLVQLVDAGQLGRKTGQGFYDYRSDE